MFELVTHAFCGMTIPHGEYEDEEVARRKTAELLVLRLNQGFNVRTLVKDQRWEVTDPDNAIAASDKSGIIALSEKAPEGPQCKECDSFIEYTGRNTPYCPSCDVCPSCGCPQADGFSHNIGCPETSEETE
jgi:hypothetical protein